MTGWYPVTDCRVHLIRRNLLKAIMMTGCDLCAVCKPWEIQQETVRYIYAEFYAQVRYILASNQFGFHYDSYLVPCLTYRYNPTA